MWLPCCTRLASKQAIEKTSFPKKRFLLQPFLCTDGAGVSKIFGQSGGTGSWPSAVVNNLHINDIRLPHLLIFDGDQYKTDSLLIREFKRFHKKVITKSIPESELSVLAPTNFFL